MQTLFVAHVLTFIAGAMALVASLVEHSAVGVGAAGALLCTSGMCAFRAGRSLAPARWQAQAQLFVQSGTPAQRDRATSHVMGTALLLFGAFLVAIGLWQALT